MNSNNLNDFDDDDCIINDSSLIILNIVVTISGNKLNLIPINKYMEKNISVDHLPVRCCGTIYNAKKVLRRLESGDMEYEKIPQNSIYESRRGRKTGYKPAPLTRPKKLQQRTIQTEPFKW